MLAEVADFLSHLSFWLFAVGVMLLLMRGMGPPGVRTVDRRKFTEVRTELDAKLGSTERNTFLSKLLLYTGKYFFSYLYYRMDLVFIVFIGGGVFLQFVSAWLR